MDSVNRRTFLGIVSAALACSTIPALGQSNDGPPVRTSRKRGRESETFILPAELAAYGVLSLVLGRASDRSVVVSALSQQPLEGYFELGTAQGKYSRKTKSIHLPPGEPTEIVFDQLQPNTQYFYRLQSRKPGETQYTPQPECRLHTQRTAGSAFSFCVQGDSHPERPQMSDPALYARTLQHASQSNPDFHICMGDDFSIEKLDEYTEQTVASRYSLQRPFLGLIAKSAPIYLVNGNHEQASLFNYNQTGTPHDAAIWAANARNKYFPTPAPDRFYSGNNEALKSIGLLKDYYAWTWGDALFVVLDNYWHSPAAVDTQLNGDKDVGNKNNGHKDRDWWAITLGDAQYQWFKRTLEQSKAKFKFVFAHHVLGSGRGGVDECDLYEWGGHNKRGDFEFKQKRPNWELPIHQLMVKHSVSIFFQGHDHLFAKQERDGIIYQEVPMPADPGYVAYNEERYQSGVKLPNSGYLRISVSSREAKVEYVRCFLQKDESTKQKHGEVAHSYVVKPKA